MPSTRDIIATAGIATPVATLSFVVKPDEMLPAAELVVGLEEVIIGAEDTYVVEGNGSGVVDDNVVDVTLTTCTRSVAISTALWSPLQVVKPI